MSRGLSDNVFKPEFLVLEEKFYGELYDALFMFVLCLIGLYTYYLLPESYVQRSSILFVTIITFFYLVIKTLLFLVNKLKIRLFLLENGNLYVKFQTIALLGTLEEERKINEIIIFHSIWKLVRMSLILSFNYNIKHIKKQARSLWFFLLIIVVPVQILIYIVGFMHITILFLASKAKFKSLKICWLLFLSDENEENKHSFRFILFKPVHTCNELKSLFNVKEV